MFVEKMTERRLGLSEHLSSGEYILRDGVFFVPGALRGSIYDINSGRVFSVNKSACEILTGKPQIPCYPDVGRPPTPPPPGPD